MNPTSDCPALVFREAPVSVGEVVRAALFWGKLPSCAAELAWKTACREEAERLDLAPDEGAVEAMVDRFRYENDLISAEETEAWLDARGLTPDEFQGYFEGCHWRERLKERVVRPAADLSEVSAELLGELQVELLMSGAFGSLAVGLGRQLVARALAEGPVAAEEVGEERRRFLERTGLAPGGVEGWLDGIDRNSDWLEGMLEMSVAWRLRCESVTTPERLARAMASARLPLTRLEVERVEFDSADAAREALLCVRDDGLSLEEVARESRYPFKRFELLAEDAPEDERQKLLCAVIGEIQGPEEEGGVIRLSRVLRKTEPSLAEPSVRRRVELRILDTYFSEACSKEVRWLIQ
jgi:hypothetical protein